MTVEKPYCQMCTKYHWGMCKELEPGEGVCHLPKRFWTTKPVTKAELAKMRESGGPDAIKGYTNREDEDTEQAFLREVDGVRKPPGYKEKKKTRKKSPTFIGMPEDAELRKQVRRKYYMQSYRLRKKEEAEFSEMLEQDRVSFREKVLRRAGNRVVPQLPRELRFPGESKKES